MQPPVCGRAGCVPGSEEVGGGAVRKWAECKGEMGSMAEGEVSEGDRF